MTFCWLTQAFHQKKSPQEPLFQCSTWDLTEWQKCLNFTSQPESWARLTASGKYFQLGLSFKYVLTFYFIWNPHKYQQFHAVFCLTELATGRKISELKKAVPAEVGVIRLNKCSVCASGWIFIKKKSNVLGSVYAGIFSCTELQQSSIPELQIAESHYQPPQKEHAFSFNTHCLFLFTFTLQTWHRKKCLF